MKSPNATFVTPQQRRLVCCAVQEEEYCFDLSDVRSIMRANQMALPSDQEPHSAIGAPLGWVAAQQDRLPVYDLAHRLALAPRPDPQTSHEGFILLLKAAPSFAVRVDRITGSIALAQAQMTALPPIVAAGTDPLFQSIAQLEEKWLLCADVARLQPHTASADRPVSAVSVVPPVAVARVNNVEPPRKQAAAQVLIFLPATTSEAGGEVVPLVFGLSITQVQQVTKLTKIISVPHAPPYVLGIINWRNRPVPIIDLKARLGLSATSANPKLIDPNSRLLIARAPHQPEPIGFLVNPQIKTFRLPIPYQALQQPLALAPDLVKGVFDLEGTPFVIPDLDAMLTRNFASLR